jgi:hypothetical protein
MAIKTVFFDVSVAAQTTNTVSSNLIDEKFLVLRVTAQFPTGQNGAVNVIVVATTDASSTSAGSRPIGTNVLGTGSYSATADPALHGDGDIVAVDHFSEWAENTYLKCYVKNNDLVNSHTVQVRVEIDDSLGEMI